ncbi:MAG: hypothetical protein WDM79_17125 [Terricaulis sp.]
MNAFEFLFTFYGLLLGLALIEVVSGFSRALDARRQRPLGLILPLLAGVMIMDIVTQWGSAWRDFRDVEFSFRYLVAAVFMTLAYYFSATQLFPRDGSDVASLDEHFFKHRLAIIGGVLFANVLVTIDAMSKQWAINGGDTVFWLRIAANVFWFATVLIALFVKRKPVVIAALAANLVFILYWLLR